MVLYQLSHLPDESRLVQQRSRFIQLRGGWRSMVCGHLCCQRPHNGGLRMLDLKSHYLTEKLAFLGRSLMDKAVRGRKVEVAFPNLKSNPKAKCCRRQRGETLYLTECRKAIRRLPESSDISRSWKELYRALVKGFTSDPLEERFDWSLEKIPSQWNGAPGSGFLNNSLTWWLAWNALPLSDFKAVWQTCLIAPDTTVAWKKRLSTPSMTASRFTCFGVTSGSEQLASIPKR